MLTLVIALLFTEQQFEIKICRIRGFVMTLFLLSQLLVIPYFVCYKD